MIESVMNSSANTRMLKRLFIGDLPDGVKEEEIVEFMSAEYEKLGVRKEDGAACVSVHINVEKNYAFAEVRWVVT
jgi:splicing factor U2AF 65 kDa subunit